MTDNLSRDSADGRLCPFQDETLDTQFIEFLRSLADCGSGLLWILLLFLGAHPASLVGAGCNVKVRIDSGGTTCFAPIWILNGETILWPMNWRGSSHSKWNSPGLNSPVQPNVPWLTSQSIPDLFRSPAIFAARFLN